MSRSIPFLFLLTLLTAGCSDRPATRERFTLVIGSPGHSSGKFNRPRGITHDTTNGMIFVVDWDGRIQKFTTNGAFRASWIMPDIQKGKPEDVCLALNGNVLVADTHYSRIVEFTPEGQKVRSFGSYGHEHGQFIYPVGICTDRDGNIYVAEYGEGDRIQKFDKDGKFLLTWGTFGAEPGQFQRPSGIDISASNTLYVADAVNHRIQVFDLEGKLLNVIGKEGTGPGEFRYPYDVSVGKDAIYVLEYGNQRVQKLTMDGKPVAMFGTPGRGDGAFANPWRCDFVENTLYVSDTDNGRVVVLPDTF